MQCGPGFEILTFRGLLDEDEGAHVVASSLVVSEAGDVIADVMEEDIETIPFADLPGISLEGGDQVVTGIDIVLRAPGQP